MNQLLNKWRNVVLGLSFVTAAAGSALAAEPLVDAAWAKANAGKQGVVFIDFQPATDFMRGHIPGAVNIPRGLLEFEVDGHPAVRYETAEALAHRERPVILYCLSGGRSALAAEALLRLGFASPMSLDHGILGWEDAGHPVVTPAQARHPAVSDTAAAACS